MNKRCAVDGVSYWSKISTVVLSIRERWCFEAYLTLVRADSVCGLHSLLRFWGEKSLDHGGNMKPSFFFVRASVMKCYFKWTSIKKVFFTLFCQCSMPKGYRKFTPLDALTLFIVFTNPSWSTNLFFFFFKRSYKNIPSGETFYWH